MIDLVDAVRIQEILIERFGGSTGVRDIKLLESSLSRPFQTIDKKDLYFSPLDKAAALIESIMINRPFIDGNKRIGFVLMRLLLMKYGFDILATKDEKLSFVLSISQGTLNYDKIVGWLKGKVKMGDILL